jgi:hypothetical protein
MFTTSARSLAAVRTYALLVLTAVCSLGFTSSLKAEELTWHYSGWADLQEFNDVVYCGSDATLWIENAWEPHQGWSYQFTVVLKIDFQTVRSFEIYEASMFDMDRDTGTISRNPLDPLIIPIEWEVAVTPGSHVVEYEVYGNSYIMGDQMDTSELLFYQSAILP